MRLFFFKFKKHKPVEGSGNSIKSIFLVFLSVFFFISTATHAYTLDEQRDRYKEAKKLLRNGNIKQFIAVSESIRNYPLYPYLRYNYLNPRLHNVKSSEIELFLQQYNTFPLAEALRTKWLKHLARTGQWQTYYDNYTPQNDAVLQCYQLQARIKTGNQTYLLEDIRSLWLSGKSQPSECDPAFALLIKSDLMNQELVWGRIRLAMENGNTGLVNYLRKYLDESRSMWASRWVEMHHNPDKGTKDPVFNDNEIAREILIHGINRLAKININTAISRWDKLKESYDFSQKELSETNRLIAVKAAQKNHPRTIELLDNISNYYVDDDVFHWRLITALENNDWQTLYKWTNGIVPFGDMELRWKYWHGRALEKLGNTEEAMKVFTSISRQRDYYSFLAADRIGQKYILAHAPLPDNQEEKAKIASMPGIIRANELKEIGENLQARREWHHALNFMTTYQKEIAATVAKDWGWYDRVIFSMGSAHSYDDLVLRFPLQFREVIDKNIEKLNLDSGWVYALIRSESAFMEDARSPAGALGLMQVMPQTGSQTARSMGWKKFSKNDLLIAEKNVPIGSTYLKQMLKMFNDNKILATAAYNAGPHRVKNWKAKDKCIDPDIWIEKIPFNETRKYVRRVLFYASIYDWRLQQEITPLQKRMAIINPINDNLSSINACDGQDISYNKSQ